jgi:hypothetical protein
MSSMLHTVASECLPRPYEISRALLLRVVALDLPPASVPVLAVVCAASACVPDIDHPGATAARWLPPLSWGVLGGTALSLVTAPTQERGAGPPYGLGAASSAAGARARRITPNTVSARPQAAAAR